MNLSNRQGEAEDSHGALASATEAVRLYRPLAGTDPTAYLPYLAGVLNNLSIAQTETGNQEGALASTTKAVHLYRTLAEGNPIATLPTLALSLTNLSNGQREADHAEPALASATEAVRLKRPLVKANPAVFLAYLAQALNGLSAALSRVDGTAPDPWAAAITDLDGPLYRVYRAELRASYARQLAEDGQRDAAVGQLATAAAEARSSDALDLERTRKAIRQIAVHLGTDDPRLPLWATRRLPEADLELINLWARQHGWPAVDAFLTEHIDAVSREDFRISLSVLSDLHPGDTTLTALLGEIDRHGLDAPPGLRADRERRRRPDQCVAGRPDVGRISELPARAPR